MLAIAENRAKAARLTKPQIVAARGNRNRNPLYDEEPAAVTIVDPAPPHLPGSLDLRVPLGCG